MMNDNFDSATIDRLFDMSSVSAGGNLGKGQGEEESSSGDESAVDFAPSMPTYGQGDMHSGAGARARRVDPELDKKVAKLVEALKQYKEKVSEMKKKMRSLVAEKKNLQETCERLEEEKQEVEFKVSQMCWIDRVEKGLTSGVIRLSET